MDNGHSLNIVFINLIYMTKM